MKEYEEKIRRHLRDMTDDLKIWKYVELNGKYI